MQEAGTDRIVVVEQQQADAGARSDRLGVLRHGLVKLTNHILGYFDLSKPGVAEEKRNTEAFLNFAAGKDSLLADRSKSTFSAPMRVWRWSWTAPNISRIRSRIAATVARTNCFTRTAI